MRVTLPANTEHQQLDKLKLAELFSVQLSNEKERRFHESLLFHIELLLCQKGKHNTTGNGRPKYAGQVWSHGMHEEENTAVFLLPYEMGNPGSNRNGSNASRTDERIDTAVGEIAHNLSTDYPGTGTKGEGHKTQDDDQ